MPITVDHNSLFSGTLVIRSKLHQYLYFDTNLSVLFIDNIMLNINYYYYYYYHYYGVHQNSVVVLEIRDVIVLIVSSRNSWFVLVGKHNHFNGALYTYTRPKEK